MQSCLCSVTLRTCGAVIAAERALKRSAALRRGAALSEDESDDEEGSADERNWGAAKDRYYDDDAVDPDVRHPPPRG